MNLSPTNVPVWNVKFDSAMGFSSVQSNYVRAGRATCVLHDVCSFDGEPHAVNPV